LAGGMCHTFVRAMDWEREIAIDAGVQGGRPVIAGTRVPVEVLVMAVASGDDLKEVASAYCVTEAQVRAALAYAGHVVASERAVALPG
jgi:uncharacterized protein (DUF433 family)